MKANYNFQVKAQSKPKSSNVELENGKLLRKFLQKWKKSGILKELRDRQYPITKGQKNRLKKRAAISRSKKS